MQMRDSSEKYNVSRKWVIDYSFNEFRSIRTEAIASQVQEERNVVHYGYWNSEKIFILKENPEQECRL